MYLYLSVPTSISISSISVFDRAMHLPSPEMSSKKDLLSFADVLKKLLPPSQGKCGTTECLSGVGSPWCLGDLQRCHPCVWTWTCPSAMLEENKRHPDHENSPATPLTPALSPSALLGAPTALSFTLFPGFHSDCTSLPVPGNAPEALHNGSHPSFLPPLDQIPCQGGKLDHPDIIFPR